jgi:hypothetical protein
VFPQRLVQTKWRQEKRDLRTGDIVLRKDETAAGQTYKYAKVVKVHTSADGKVRAADIKYKLPGESVFRTTTRPIHKLVLIIPVEEQVSAGATKAESPAPKHTEAGPVAIREKDPGEKKEEVPARPTTPPTQDKNTQKPVIRPKKVISRKKAGRQTRAVIVAAPKEEAEMVDIKTGPRKRGRPRKAPAPDSPGPNKGSVLYPRVGKCTDPVSEDAILEREGGNSPDRSEERQLVTDTGGDKT